MTQRQPFTKAELDAHLRRAWQKCGFDLADDARMGVSIEELLAESEQRNNKLVDQHFDLWIAVYDEFVSWLLSLITVVYPSSRAKSPAGDFERAVTVLIMRILADSFSIRILMLRGFDASAKVILRSTSEHIQMLVAIITDPTIATEFAKTRHPNTAAAFWRKHVRRGALQQQMKKAWMEFFRGEARPAKWFANWGTRDHQMYSAIAHPSMFGCINATLPWKKEVTDENWLGFMGDRSLASIETVRTYLSLLFPMLLIIGDFPFGRKSSPYMRPRRYQSKNELHRHVRHGRSLLGSLILSLNHEPNLDLVFPKDAVTWGLDRY